MTTFRAIQVSSPRGELALVDHTVAEPGPGSVRVAVEACGICHSDSLFVDDLWPGVQFPVTPGHEIAGRVDALGEGVGDWRVGDRVAIGWSGGYCGQCRPCRRGDFVHCEVGMVTGVSFPGGYGIGGLGHLGVQFAVKMGFRTVAIARGPEKGELARELGAHHYIDSTASEVATELQKLGGARVVAATATNAEAITAALGGLGLHGELLTLAALTDPVQVSPTQLITISGTVHGHPAGASSDLQDTLDFAALQGIKPTVEVLPLEKAADGYQRMMANQARFRVVLTTAS